ncbi:hypothetical protein IIA15_11030 [candidate division TA06 bacterium]|nr:hypothetical protein [candidate division TA06 bacterium]
MKKHKINQKEMHFEILVDENWGTIKKVAQTVYRKHRVSRVEVEALMAG